MIEKRILTIQGLKVIVDADLAELYGVTTRRLNEQVKRNRGLFPADFMFKLTEKEKQEVVANCDHLSIRTGSLYGEKGTKDINTYHIMTLDFKNEEIHIWGRRWVPEHSMWTTFMDNSRDTFSFPGKHG